MRVEVLAIDKNTNTSTTVRGGTIEGRDMDPGKCWWQDRKLMEVLF